MCIERDREALLRLWKESLANPRTGDSANQMFAWLYDGNPYGSTSTWLLREDQSNAAVGCVSLLPRRAVFRGRAIRLGVAADLAVEVKHRFLGPALTIQRTVIADSREAGFDLLIGCPNQKSVALMQRAGFNVVADIQFWVKPIRSKYKLRELLKNEWLTKASGAVVDAGLAIPNLFHRVTRSRDYVGQILRQADKRFDDLWDTAKSKYGIIGEKTAAYLNWRYGESGGVRYGFYCLFRRKDEQLLGYVVFTATGKKVLVAELLCVDLHGPVLRSLLLGFSSQMKRAGHESIWLKYVGTPAFGRQLKCCGFFDRGVSGKFVACVNTKLPADVQRDFLLRENWFIFRGEMDL